MKSIDNMTDHEMLMELVAEKRMRDKLRFAKILLWAVVILLLIWLGATYIPKFIEVYNKWNTILQQIQDTGNKVNGVVEDLKSGPLQTIQNGLESVKGGVDSVKDFLSKLGF